MYPVIPMDESLRSQLETYLSRLDELIRRGHHLRDTLTDDPSNPSSIATTRLWQEDCGATINQLAGGSKSHWLARSFSEAFLKRSPDGTAAEGAAPSEIVARLLRVLEQAVASLSQMNGSPPVPGAPSFAQAPPPRRFDFVHNAELRPVLEQAYADSRRALDLGDYRQALEISCGILESIVTDALEHRGLPALAVAGAPAGRIADWSFNTRLAVAERAGLIGGGCARLPAAARMYRDHEEGGSSNATVSERDARVAGQVLRVVMRDLDPGR